DEQLQRALEVGEEDRHLLALAGQRGAGGQDLAREMGRRVDRRRGEAITGGDDVRQQCGALRGIRLEGGPALLAEFVAGGVERRARRAERVQASATLAAELRALGVDVLTLRTLHIYSILRGSQG